MTTWLRTIHIHQRVILINSLITVHDHHRRWYISLLFLCCWPQYYFPECMWIRRFMLRFIIQLSCQFIWIKIIGVTSTYLSCILFYSQKFSPIYSKLTVTYLGVAFFNQILVIFLIALVHLLLVYLL